MLVKIVKVDGEVYETPISNLENVKRLIKYTDIIYPGEEEEEKVVKPAIVTKPNNKKPIKS
jgi:hypothetical protein